MKPRNSRRGPIAKENEPFGMFDDLFTCKLLCEQVSLCKAIVYYPRDSSLANWKKKCYLFKERSVVWVV